MPTVGNQEFPYTEEGMSDASMAAAGVDPTQQAMEMELGGGSEEMPPMSMEEGEEAGRGGDVMLAHMTPGEVVIPAEIASNPDVLDTLNAIFAEAQADISQYTVGDPLNNINPETGYPEFGFFSSLFGGSSRRAYRRQQEQYNLELEKSREESRRMMAEQKQFFKNQMTEFQSKQAAETALFNKQMAEDQDRARVMAIRNKRKFADTMFGLAKKKTKVSKEVAATGETTSPRDFSAPKFYGSKRSGKSTPKFKRPRDSSSYVRPT